MTLWLRVRHARTCAATIVAVAVAVVLAGTLFLPLPNLLGGPPLAVPLALLLPLAVSIVVAWGLTTGDPLLESVASRPLHLLDAAYALATATLTLLTCTLAWQLVGAELALAAGRNALGYVGLTLLGRRLLGSHAAGVLPAGCAVAVSLFGSGGDSRPRWWAWPLFPADNPIAWASAVALLVLGATVALKRADAVIAER